MQHGWKYTYFELKDKGYKLLQNDDILVFKEQPSNLTKRQMQTTYLTIILVTVEVFK